MKYCCIWFRFCPPKSIINSSCVFAKPEGNRNFSTFVENFMKAPKSNRLVYKTLVSAKQSSPRKSQQKWSAD